MPQVKVYFLHMRADVWDNAKNTYSSSSILSSLEEIDDKLEFKTFFWFFFLWNGIEKVVLLCASGYLDKLNLNVAQIKSGQKWLKNNHLTTFAKVQSKSLIHSL